MGDAIHTVKPYFGLGVNSAFEDIISLQSALNKTNDQVDKAMIVYSKERSKQAEAMVKISRGIYSIQS